MQMNLNLLVLHGNIFTASIVLCFKMYMQPIEDEKIFSILGHALGFWHEQSRYDRDNYIRILSENIQDGMEGQFSKESQRDFQTFGYPYDLGSVMHYGSSVRALLHPL